MKLIAQIARILVGIEFIFSGFVKVVDPYGTGLKLQEYFEVFAEDLPFLSGLFELFASQSQTLSLIFCAAELILGVALLVSFKMPKTAWVVLGLMGFFTFLTFYSAYFNKVTDCGCFGDFLKLKPWTSFYKDIISLGVILIIFFNRKSYNEWFMAKPITLIATIIAFGIGLYAKRYLPILDFLPYAKGLSIAEQMQPTGVKPIIEYTFLDKVNNEELQSVEYLMDTAQYKYLSSVVLNEDEIQPKITDFSVTGIEGDDLTQDAFTGKRAFYIFKKLKGISEDELKEMADLGTALQKQGFEIMTLTSLLLEDFNTFHSSHHIPGTAYNTDEKVLKAMARTNPVIYVLEDGVVKGKWSSHNIPSESEVLDVLK
ncbi:BT_3928 family protein [Jiulongibacter sp. NS-SX5]|uniref:BT_3928 family protein n=1 Tax=Jiulongibacter sp. NS-SX5 TaxID=3463854 RepID=UPI004057FFC1